MLYEILTVEDTKTTLDYCVDNEKWPQLCLLVLQSFCGIRVAESGKLKWSAINMEDQTVTVDGDVAKQSLHRINHIPTNALVWLQLIYGKLGINESKKDELILFDEKNQLAAIREGVKKKHPKVKFPRNSMRHNFASYHFAAFENAGKTRSMMGHRGGEALFFDEYRTLTTKPKGVKFFGLLPNVNKEMMVDWCGDYAEMFKPLLKD